MRLTLDAQKAGRITLLEGDLTSLNSPTYKTYGCSNSKHESTSQRVVSYFFLASIQRGVSSREHLAILERFTSALHTMKYRAC